MLQVGFCNVLFAENGNSSVGDRTKTLWRAKVLVLAPFLAMSCWVSSPTTSPLPCTKALGQLGPQQWDKLFGKAELPLAKISPDCAVSKCSWAVTVSICLICYVPIFFFSDTGYKIKVGEVIPADSRGWELPRLLGDAGSVAVVEPGSFLLCVCPKNSRWDVLEASSGRERLPTASCSSPCCCPGSSTAREGEDCEDEEGHSEVRTQLRLAGRTLRGEDKAEAGRKDPPR
ncbi:hypothetical protein DV515_00014023 [Chloebia gouldiae]|uniref:Uncharacterized protein n=1 Tax=Chloebia gouldiae TaxID=44316 RepID=A0A3L8RZE2_CHLGU|nr:hypothetical protein DV515_00014023 [Chloebia gouldiae]